MALRVDLADVLLGEGDVLRLRAGDHDLMRLVVLLLLVHVASRQGDGDQRKEEQGQMRLS